MEENAKYISVRFETTNKTYTFSTTDPTIKNGDAVVVETQRGMEYSYAVSDPFDKPNVSFEIKPIIRKANEKDKRQFERNKADSIEAKRICQEESDNLDLKMNVISAEYTLDRAKITFTYLADDRVDFRELLKVLASIFHCRIDLRQVGTRDKAKMVSGIGVCGRELCCAKFIGEFDRISINMAKNQLLALNIQKLSGQCGNLMCCLRFEDDAYKDLRKDLPKLNKTGRIETEPYGDANEYHKKFHFTLRDGSTADLDIQTAFSYLCFPGDGTTVTLPWSEIVSVSLDWEKPCMSDWPAYARFHLQDGTTVIVPSHTLTVGAHKKPDENQLSFNLYYQLPSTLKTARGYEADFSEIRAIAFGKGAYAPNPDKWTEEIQPGWITDLPVSILFRDGRVLETTVAMDWVKFFALDEFGTFAAIPDQIRYLDFVTDLSEETEPPAVRDSAQLPE